VTRYSHSRLSSFENCPRKFAYRYVDQIETERESIEAFVGKRVHEILERLYHHVARHGKPPSLAQVQSRFRSDWLAAWHEQIEIVRNELDVAHYQKLGERCLENYYRRHYPFDGEETVAIEHEVQFALDPEGRYKLRGIIDRVVRREPGRYEIHDYKTGGYLPPRKRIDSDRQLALYQIGLSQAYPDAREFELVWHYLAHNRTLRSTRTPEQLDKLRGETIALIDQIEATTDYPTRTNALCRWCEYRGICPAQREGDSADAGTQGTPVPPLASIPPRQLPLL
jgi:putative RecB family exonuclease